MWLTASAAADGTRIAHAADGIVPRDQPLQPQGHGIATAVVNHVRELRARQQALQANRCLHSPAPHAAGSPNGTRLHVVQRPPVAAAQSDADEVILDVSDQDVAPVSGDAAAARLRASSALQMEARIALAASAGCSRAVSQHAVALLADLQGSNYAAGRSGGGGDNAGNGTAGITQQHAAAACWQYHVEQRGCSRAVSRADVTSLVRLLQPPTASVERLEVSLIRSIVGSHCACCHGVQCRVHPMYECDLTEPK